MDTTTDTRELTAIENKLVDVILEARTKRFSVSGDFARANAAYVAMAASQQLITTKIHADVYGREWVPTVLGLRFLSEIELGEDE